MAPLHWIGYALSAILLLGAIIMTRQNKKDKNAPEHLTNHQLMEIFMTINSKLDAILAAVDAIPAGGSGSSAQLTQIASDVTAIKNEIGISTSTPPATLPVVSSVTPATGPVAGGTTVIVAGTGFTEATAANFGTLPGASLSVTSDTSLTVISPALAAGVADVTVVTPAGISAVVAADQFTAA